MLCDILEINEELKITRQGRLFEIIYISMFIGAPVSVSMTGV